MATNTVEIPSHIQVDVTVGETNAGVQYYNLALSSKDPKKSLGGQATTISQRFSSFEALHRNLRSAGGGTKVPPLPEKSIFSSPLVEKRGQALHQWIQQTMDSCPEVRKNSHFQAFLGFQPRPTLQREVKEMPKKEEAECLSPNSRHAKRCSPPNTHVSSDPVPNNVSFTSHRLID